MTIHEIVLVAKGFITGAFLVGLCSFLYYINQKNYRKCKYCKYFMHIGPDYKGIIRGLCNHDRAYRTQDRIENEYYCGNFEMCEALSIDLQRQALDKSYRKSNSIFNQLKSKINDK